jgi:hypothetical protein
MEDASILRGMARPQVHQTIWYKVHESKQGKKHMKASKDATRFAAELKGFEKLPSNNNNNM